MIGRRVGHYDIVEKLGQGGMGEVYRAEDTSLGRTVARKFLPEALHVDPQVRRRFLREARSAAALDHPYICHVFEVAQTDAGRDFIAMEYLAGETLQAGLGRSRGQGEITGHRAERLVYLSCLTRWPRCPAHDQPSSQQCLDQRSESAGPSATDL